MMSGYNPKSCSALEKPFYRPVEAALRWCGLIDHESEILEVLNGGRAIPETGQFPQWPCLQANAEKIVYAINCGYIPYGRDGKNVGANEHVRADKLTVRHTDLREWMAKHHPDQKPAFLFDEIERKTHAAINADAFLVLRADLDAALSELGKEKARVADAIREMNEMRVERDSLQAKVDKAKVPSERAEIAYLNIIGAMLEVVLCKPPESGDRPYSEFKSQGAFIEKILLRHGYKYGISKRTLEDKFAEANRSLTSA